MPREASEAWKWSVGEASSADLPPPQLPSPGLAGGGGGCGAGARLVGLAARGGGIMAAPSPHTQQLLLRCSVKLLLAQEELPAGLQLASPSQKALQLEVQPGEEDADVTVTDG